MNRPSMFIGSSSEGKQIAQHVSMQLKDDAEVTIWNEGVFGLGQGTLESLVQALDRFDFAVLVLTPDDMVESRANRDQSPRDNVLFECGLFMGRLGRERTFIVYDADQVLKIPSDLAGVTHAQYRGKRADGNLLAAVGEACYPIRHMVQQQGSREAKMLSDISVGSARLVFLLRYLDNQPGVVRTESIGKVLYAYKDPSSPINAPYEEKGWGRAANYALLYLGALGLVEHSGYGVKISQRGQRYLKLTKVQADYTQAFQALTDIEKADLQTDVTVEYRREDYPYGTFTICNKGMAEAKDVIIEFELNDPHAVYVPGGFSIEDGKIKIPSLNAAERFPIQVKFNRKPDRAKASWSWKNLNGSSMRQQQYFNL